jgi:hypothetical protein
MLVYAELSYYNIQAHYMTKYRGGNFGSDIKKEREREIIR